MNTKPTKEFVKTFADAQLFAGIERQVAGETIRSCATVKKAKKGELLQIGGTLCCLVKGSANVGVINAGKAVVKQLFKGDVFGCAALFESDLVTDISAITDCTLLCISADDMQEIFQKQPRLAVNYIKYLSGKIRYLNQRIGDFAFGTAEEKVMRFLRENAGCDGVVRIKMTLLAEQLGMGRTSLYRALDSLQKDKKILRNKNKIEIL